MHNIILLLSIALFMSSCTATKAIIAMSMSTEQFIVLEDDTRVLYERGAKKSAQVIANKLTSAINTVEHKQYKKFTKPVTVYVCNSIESFTDYCVHSQASGCVLNERLFLSPKNFQNDQNALTHELSHLHIEQQLGMFTWHARYPAWFQEGLATYVSDGEGAHRVSIDDAREAIANGKTFTPDTSGNLIFRKTAHSFGLTPNMFYRQAALFIAYLHHIDTIKFKTLILSIEKGKAFEQSFFSAYGEPLCKIWQAFVQQQKSMFKHNDHAVSTSL